MRAFDMSDIEVYNIDYDEDLISHLSIPESLNYLWGEEFSDKLIVDELTRDIFHWQFNHRREHGSFATASVLAEQFDLDLVEPLTAIGDLHERIAQRYVKNNARALMEQVSEAYKEDPALVVEVLPRVARELTDIVSKKGEAYGTGDFDRNMQKYDEFVLKGPGPSFGFDLVNNHFHGMRGLTFGIAPPKTMKSWIFGAKILSENVLDGRNGWLASLELPADETDMRIRCMVADVPYWRYLRGSISADDRRRLKEASDIMDECGSYNVVKPAPGHRSFEEMVERAGDAGAEFIIIDQLQYVETLKGKQLGACEWQEYWQPLNAARDMSDDIPIFVIHQFNRSVMNADEMPQMQQAKGAAAIEETASLALGLWANKDMRSSNVIELGTLASRHYGYESWEISVELSRGCDFEMIGPVRDKDPE
jgi:hypothetical protein